MYQEFYGFREMPFHITPNPRFLFLSPTHYEALQHLRYGIEERKGFIVVTGEVGCGKTTLCRALLNELDDPQYETALIMNPRISETQLLSMILQELGETSDSTNQTDLLSQLNTVLLDRIAQNKEIIVIIDEAQNLSFEVMEQLRLLSNLETDEQKLLQIILLGQPELKQKLNEKRLRQFRQRVLVYYDLTPLQVEETKKYVQHRMSTAGSNGRPTFTPRALRKLHRSSKGVPRLINNLCDKALLSAFIRRSDVVNWWDMHKAIKDLNRIR